MFEKVRNFWKKNKRTIIVGGAVTSVVYVIAYAKGVKLGVGLTLYELEDRSIFATLSDGDTVINAQIVGGTQEDAIKFAQYLDKIYDDSHPLKILNNKV